MWRLHRLGLHVQIGKVLLGEHVPVWLLAAVDVAGVVRSRVHGAEVVGEWIGRGVHGRGRLGEDDAENERGGSQTLRVVNRRSINIRTQTFSARFSRDRTLPCRAIPK